MTQDQIIQQALQILAGRMRGSALVVFACVFLDSQARELGTRALQERSHRRLRQRLRVGI
jgi:hypothetical protein